VASSAALQKEMNVNGANNDCAQTLSSKVSKKAKKLAASRAKIQQRVFVLPGKLPCIVV